MTRVRWWAVLGASALAVATGGCSVSVGSSKGDGSGWVKDDQVTLDLRHRPTREEVHLPSGDRGNVYDAGSQKLRVTVLLPWGSTVLDAYRITVTASNASAPPAEIVVNASYSSPEEAGKALRAQQKALELTEESLAPVAGSATTAAGGQGTVDGAQQPDLSISADVRKDSPTSTLVNWSFAFDVGQTAVPSVASTAAG